MRFDLRINPDWRVIDARTGLEVTHIRWVDDATHEVAWCECARAIDGYSTGSSKKSIAIAALQMGVSGKQLLSGCDDDQFVKPMPKVVFHTDRKLVMVNVNEEFKQDDEDYTEPAEPHRYNAPARRRERVPALPFDLPFEMPDIVIIRRVFVPQERVISKPRS
jgi:hypothetical protein